MTGSLRPGEVVLVGSAASVQFSRPFRFRLIKAQTSTTCDGWAWLDGYQLDGEGQAVERRTIFVQLAGLRRR